MTGGVAHFEIHADDTSRARKFYETVFGWTFQRLDDQTFEYWLITTGEPNQGGGMMPRSAPAPAAGSSPNSFVVTIGVDSVDETVRVATGAGAQVAAPKVGIGGMGWVAYLTDTEGNLFGVFETDPNAAWVG